MDTPRAVTCHVARNAPPIVHRRVADIGSRLDRLRADGHIDGYRIVAWPGRRDPRRATLLERLEAWAADNGVALGTITGPSGHVRLPPVALVRTEGEAIVDVAPRRGDGVATVETVLRHLEGTGWQGARRPVSGQQPPVPPGAPERAGP